jgi:predicted RNase H-related nuclease YkuK (DUF458 family)
MAQDVTKRKEWQLNAAKIMDTSVFKKLDGTVIDDVAQYVKDYFYAQREKNIYGFEIFIGSDSQRVRKGRLTLYSTVICLYTVGRGAHIIYARTKRNDIAPTARKTKRGAKRPADSGLFYRLQWEVEYSMQVANYLNENNVFAECGIAQMHFDIAVNPEHDSNIAYNYAVGYAKNFGYNPRTKPEAIAASYAADMCVRR